MKSKGYNIGITSVSLARAILLKLLNEWCIFLLKTGMFTLVLTEVIRIKFVKYLGD
jgi:hypothetical protein